MTTIWATFLAAGAALLALGVAGLRWKGDQSQVFRTIGRFLIGLALATAVFPSILAVLDPVRWAMLYVALVLVVTAVMTTIAVVRSRAPRS